MLLKTYKAPNLAQALKQARAEMGPDALVLGTRETTGRFGLSAIEVTVGASRAPAGEAGAGNDSPPRLAEEVQDLHRSLERTREKVTVRAPTSAPREKTNGHHPGLLAAVDALVASGVSPDLAQRFARIASVGLSDAPNARAIAEATAQGMRNLLTFAPPPLSSRCTFVVGPPGCGKTTTVAKLVARAAATADRRVCFAEADQDRIGAYEQAEIFSRYIGVPSASVAGSDDLLLALRRVGESGMVFVDTPGIGAGDRQRLQELLEIRNHVPHASVALLVPAGLHQAEATRVIERFAPLAPTCVGLTRVDDGAMPGELVTALAQREFPLAFFTNGRSVPGDFEAASPHGLAALLLRAGSAPLAQPEMSH